MKMKCLLGSAAALLLAIPCASFVPQSAYVSKNIAVAPLNLFGRFGAATPTKSPSADAAVALFADLNAKKRSRPTVESDLRDNYAELSKIFGDEMSLGLVKTTPAVLQMERSYFAGTYAVFCEKFGVDETDALLLRNPGLLAIKPDGWGPDGYAGAGEAGPETIAMSYVIAATRPLGKYGVFGLVGLLSVPALEQVTGISRSVLLSQLLGS